jgi:hypothetical protein
MSAGSDFLELQLMKKKTARIKMDRFFMGDFYLHHNLNHLK